MVSTAGEDKLHRRAKSKVTWIKAQKQEEIQDSLAMKEKLMEQSAVHPRCIYTNERSMGNKQEELEDTVYKIMI